MPADHEVSVHYRHVELQSVATLRVDGDGEAFLELAEPPPVRTVLELRGPSARSTAYEVTAVVEVEAPGAIRGCRLREVDAARLSSRAVGSERLADAAAGSVAGSTAATARGRTEASGDESWSNDYGVQMAVPAPVVDPDGGDDSSEAEIGSNGDDDDGSGSAADSDASRSAGGGKKRRGRRRK
ncbi:MAG TPA: hypothetical protein VFG69_19565 [Nannocystaceae bacterium]|nr:hypothetical protein [Nannocystaceae bacterium]